MKQDYVQDMEMARFAREAKHQLAKEYKKRVQELMDDAERRIYEHCDTGITITYPEVVTDGN